MRKIRWAILDSILRRKRTSGTPTLVVVGLGNPGKRYAQTRHNVGVWCVERLAEKHSIAFSQRHRLAVMGEGAIDGRDLIVAKPRTYVNNSGQAVSYLLTRYRATPDVLMVVYDDMNLPPGKLRLRPGGSAGGHNGIKSVIDALGTEDFPRLRVGIGRPPSGSDEVSYVLGTMSTEEQAQVMEASERAVQAVASVVSEGITAAMNKFN